jgi:hypothetical protein
LVKFQEENPSSYELVDVLQAWIRLQDLLGKNPMRRYYSIIRCFTIKKVGYIGLKIPNQTYQIIISLSI